MGRSERNLLRQSIEIKPLQAVGITAGAGFAADDGRRIEKVERRVAGGGIDIHKDAQQPVQLNMQAGLFEDFPYSAGFGMLARFQEAAGDIPIPFERLLGPFDQEQLSPIQNERAGTGFGILIKYKTTTRADQPLVLVNDLKGELVSALGAKRVSHGA